MFFRYITRNVLGNKNRTENNTPRKKIRVEFKRRALVDGNIPELVRLSIRTSKPCYIVIQKTFVRTEILPAVKMDALTVCNHGVLAPSKTLGKLTVKCEGCKHRKKRPWAKMVKCCRTYNKYDTGRTRVFHWNFSTIHIRLFCTECKKLWHPRCLLPQARSSLELAVEPQPELRRDCVKEVFHLSRKLIRNESYRCALDSFRRVDVARSLRVDHGLRESDSNENTSSSTLGSTPVQFLSQRESPRLGRVSFTFSEMSMDDFTLLKVLGKGNFGKVNVVRKTRFIKNELW